MVKSLKKKLKGILLPTIYVTIIGVLFISITYLGKILQNNINSNNDLTVNALVEEEVPVVSEVKDMIVRPYTSTGVAISKYFYDMKDDANIQEESLIYYENTYMQNSGVLYKGSEVFDINTVFNGTVTKVATDDILGNYIEITHNTNLRTVYYSLSEVLVKENDTVKSGDIIAKSGANKLDNNQNNLLFEVYYNGYAIDPEDFYNMNVDDLK